MGAILEKIGHQDMDDAYKGRSRAEHVTEDGRTIPSTKIITEEMFYSYAKAGYSLSWVAVNILGVSKSALLAEVKKREVEPSYRIRKYAKNYTNPKFPDDYVAFFLFKGTKDRYTPYMTLYEQATRERKGLSAETLGNDGEYGSEKVGVV